MKMNHFVIPAMLLFGMTTACVESTPSLQIGGAAPQNDDCSFPDTEEVSLLRGSVNLGLTGGYPLVFGVTSNLESTLIEVGDQPVGGDEDLNTIYITEQLLSYTTSSGLVIPQPAGPIPLYGTLNADGQLLLNLLTAEADAYLRGAVGGAGQPVAVEVLVTMSLKGKRASGDEVESNEITYPITVLDVDFETLEAATCGEGRRFAASDDVCDQSGLNGVLPPCEAIPPPPPPPPAP